VLIEIKPGDDLRIDEQNLLDLCDAELGTDNHNPSPELRKGFFLGFRCLEQQFRVIGVSAAALLAGSSVIYVKAGE